MIPHTMLDQVGRNTTPQPAEPGLLAVTIYAVVAYACIMALCWGLEVCYL